MSCQSEILPHQTIAIRRKILRMEFYKSLFPTTARAFLNPAQTQRNGIRRRIHWVYIFIYTLGNTQSVDSCSISAMLELLLTVLPSVVWLLYRCYTILHTPVEILVRKLNIEIPHAPTICIDSVSHDSVIIHWDIEVSENEELIFIILVNNKEGMYHDLLGWMDTCNDLFHSFFFAFFCFHEW